jgi:hypothetical protein
MANRIQKKPIETRTPPEHGFCRRRNRPDRESRIVRSIEHLEVIQLLIETQTHHHRAIHDHLQVRAILKNRHGGVRSDGKRVRIRRGARRFVHSALALT